MDSKKSLAKTEHKKTSVFGRRKSRPLSLERQQALDALLPELEIQGLAENHSLDPQTLFSTKNSLVLELGFGSGEHVAGMMEREPDTGFLAAEPFVNGMSAFLKDLLLRPERNVRVLMDDGMILAKSLTPESIDRIYILNPDPWHKTRHHKRRLVNTQNLDIFAKILKPGGELILTTDVPDLANWMMTHTYNHPAFHWTAENSSDWTVPPANWITTRYEVKKAKGATKMSYLFFKKNI